MHQRAKYSSLTTLLSPHQTIPSKSPTIPRKPSTHFQPLYLQLELLPRHLGILHPFRPEYIDPENNLLTEKSCSHHSPPSPSPSPSPSPFQHPSPSPSPSLILPPSHPFQESLSLPRPRAPTNHRPHPSPPYPPTWPEHLLISTRGSHRPPWHYVQSFFGRYLHAGVALNLCIQDVWSDRWGGR